MLKKLFLDLCNMLRPNKKISVFRVTGLKILDRVGTHTFNLIFFLEKNILFYAF